MIGQASYYKQSEAEDAMSVVAGWIGQNRKIQVRYHNGNAVDADIRKGVIRIPRMACASGVTQEALMHLRHRVYHESGHIDETNVDKPAGALGEIMNALEDRRMEASEAKKHKGCEVVFRWGNEWYNKEIASKAMNGEINAPLWEALVAMSFQVEGLIPAWTLSKKAQTYVDAAYDEFAKVKLCKNAKDALELSKKVLALLKDANEQYKKENPNPQQQQGQQQDKDGEPQEQDGEPQSGGQGDLDDEDEQQDSESQSGQGQSDLDEDEEGQEQESKGSGKSGESDEEGDESGKSDSDSDGDEDSESESGKGNDSDSDDDDSDSAGESGDSDEDAESIQTSNADGEKTDGPDADMPYQPNDERQKGGNDGQDEDDEADEWKDTDLEDELDGQSKEDALNEAIKEYLDDIDPADAAYLSRRDLDEHNVPKTRDSDKATFKKEHEEIAVMTASMTRSLEQALRSICRCKREGYKRQGRIDHKRLTAIAKGLSREVFFKIKDGQNLECAVEIIIDESGSMGNYHQVRLLAIAIGEALNAIGVPFEITGTTTKYGMGGYGMPPLDGMARTNPIIYNHYVMFGEGWQTVRHRLVHTGAHMHNIDGEAIEYCAFRLAQRPERRKVIFSLSDGSPMGGQGTDSELGRNIIRVCNKARKNGIEVYGFGIQTEDPKRYYGKDFFVYLDDPTTMDQVFIKKFADVVTGGRVRV